MKSQNAQEAKKDSKKVESNDKKPSTDIQSIAKKVEAIEEKVEAIETKVKGKSSKVSGKVKNQKGELKVTLLVNPLAVYSKKSMEGKPSNIKAGTEVILTPLENSIRVKKANSSRTFYTNKKAVSLAV